MITVDFMSVILIFVWIYAAMIALSFVESYVEGRNAWDKKKYGPKISIGKLKFTGYHFFLFGIMLPLFITLPLIIAGWNKELFGILLSAYFSGIVVEDLSWYIVNPVVKFKELFSNFSDYYPWIKINGKKIIPAGYILWLALAVSSWVFLWR
jgi:hypothetical protein